MRRVALLLVLVFGVGCPKKMPSSVTDSPPPTKPPAQVASPSDARDPDGTEPRAVSRLDPSETETSKEDVRALLQDVDRILGLLAERSLSDAEGEERDAAATFVAQAREALDSGDPDRALVLAEKARVLMESLERATRP